MKALYYGDNLQVLRDSIATESVDLIYLDPPFKSKATHNVGNQVSSGWSWAIARSADCSHCTGTDTAGVYPIARPFPLAGFNICPLSEI